MEEARWEPWSILEWSLHVAEIGMTSRFWETIVLVLGRTHNRKKTIEIMRTTLIFAKKQTSKQRCLFLIASDFNLPVILSSSCWDLCHLCTLSTYKGRYLKKNEFNFFAKGHWCESLLIKKTIKRPKLKTKSTSDFRLGLLGILGWGGSGVLNKIVDFGGPKWHLES